MDKPNMSAREKAAIRAIEMSHLDKLIAQAIANEGLGDLRQLPLAACGAYVALKSRYFKQSLIAHSRARSGKKRSETIWEVERDGRSLSYAMYEMKQMLESEERDALRF